jgi:hypothetical protein
MNYFQLLTKLDKIYDQHAGQTLTTKAIVSKLNRAIPFTECKITAVGTLGLPENNYQVSGVYEPDLDEDGECCIELEISFPKRKTSFYFGEQDLGRKQWNHIVLDLVSVLGHEFVHLHQFRRREFRDGREFHSTHTSMAVKESQEYFGIPDEVDAYAFTAAANMAYQLYIGDKTAKVKDTGVYQVYVNVFDKKHPVVLKLEKLTKQYYKRLERQYHATNRLN